MTVIVDNLYVVQNGDGTVDTISGPVESAVDLIEAAGFIHGGTTELVQVSSIEDLDLCSHELRFDFVQSMN
jgi:hypothetical protein